MNLILVQPEDTVEQPSVVVSPEDTSEAPLNTTVATFKDERRVSHIFKILKPEVGANLTVGYLNGSITKMAEVISVSSTAVSLKLPSKTCSSWRVPPPKLPIELIVALPRPTVLGRLIMSIASLGVRKLTLIPGLRVESSYWSSHKIQPPALNGAMHLGMEQGKDSHAMEIQVIRNFKSYFEDWKLREGVIGQRALHSTLNAEGQKPETSSAPRPLRLFAHLEDAQIFPYDEITAAMSEGGGGTVAVIGPEGGWLPEEVEIIKDSGFKCVSLGDRVLKTETAVSVLIGRMLR